VTIRASSNSRALSSRAADADYDGGRSYVWIGAANSNEGAFYKRISDEEASMTVPALAQFRPLSFKSVAVDTETSGLFDFKRPADAPGQPRLAEVAMIFLDEMLREERRYQAFIKPDGWVMEPGATEANKLTTEFLLEHGVPVVQALDAYRDAIEEGRVVVAHHAQNDCKIMRAELRRAGRPDLFDVTRNVCTMRALTGVCRIQQKNGRGLKWPSLEEACAHFGIPTEGLELHGASVDASLVAELLRRMHAIDVIPDPKVHPAKTPPAGGPSYEVVE
jgi:DNA polymerase III subunit epsilon